MNMKKCLLMVAAALFFAACNDNDNKDTFEEELSRSGKVSLVASLEGMDTRMSMPSTGHGRWEEGDQIAVACSDGSFVTFDLEGTGGTVRAKFTGEIPSGLSLGNVAVWPPQMAVRVDGDDVTLRFPSEYSDNVETLNIPMVASIGDSWHIEFKQVASYLSVSVGNLPEGTTSIVVDGAGKNLSGEFVQKASKLGTAGVEESSGESGIRFSLTSPAVKAVFDAPIPSADYDSLVVTAFNSEGNALTSQAMRYSVSYGRGTRPTLAYTMVTPPVVVEIPYVEVCGVKWALGNLSYDVAGGDKGFRDGWKLAPQQWYYYHYNQRPAFNGSSKPYNGTAQRTDVATTATAYDHFNWAGITDSFTKSTESYAAPEPGTDLVGRMFSDKACQKEVKDFDQAAFGDLAYWASNGLCHTPTVAELKAVYEQASIKYGHLVVPDPDDESGSIKVWGYLFTNPAGERTVELADDLELTDDEVKAGLFLPVSGRKASSSDTQIIYTRYQGIYWTSQAASKAGYAYVLQLKMDNSVNKRMAFGEAQVLNVNYPNNSGFCIRPVVND